MPSSVDLGKKLEQTVNDLIKSGRYNSRSEVLREGVRLVEEREARLAALDVAIARGVADGDASRITPAASTFDRLAAREVQAGDEQVHERHRLLVVQHRAQRRQGGDGQHAADGQHDQQFEQREAGRR